MASFRPSPDRRRLVGFTLIATGILGLLISLAGMFLVGYAGATAQAALKRQVDVVDNALAATSDGLIVAEGALVEAERTLGNLSSAVGNTSRALSDTQPSLEALQALTDVSLPETIVSTQLALDGAAETAAIIDAVLSTLSVFGVRYNPDVPLNVAIEQVSQSLADVPPALNEVAAGLDTAGNNLATIADDLNAVETGLQTIASDLREATGVIEQYQGVVTDLQEEAAKVGTTVPGWISATRWGLTLLLIWLGLAQIGLLAQGWELLQQTGDRASALHETDRH